MLRGIASIIQVRAGAPPTPHPCRARDPPLRRSATPSPSIPCHPARLPLSGPPPLRSASPCPAVYGCYTHRQNSNNYLSVIVLWKWRRYYPDIFLTLFAD